jgi:hypothetical protein
MYPFDLVGLFSGFSFSVTASLGGFKHRGHRDAAQSGRQEIRTELAQRSLNVRSSQITIYCRLDTHSKARDLILLLPFAPDQLSTHMRV